MKKTLIIVGVIILIIIAGGYYLNLSLGGGFGDPALRIEASQTPDKTTELACSNDVKVDVITHTRVKTGNKLELGTESTLIEVSDLKIEFGGKSIVRTSEDLAQFPLQFPSGFPIGFTIDNAFALSSGAKARIDSGSNVGPTDYTGIVVKSDEISAEDTRAIATCLKQHANEINAFLPQTLHTGTSVALGWAARIPSGFTTYSSLAPRQVFTCPNNGGVVTVQGGDISYSTDGSSGSWQGVGNLLPNGEIKFDDNPKWKVAVQTFKNVNKSACKDTSGATLLDALTPLNIILI